MNEFDILLITIGISLINTLLSVLVERIIMHFGLTRGNTLWLAIIVLFFAIMNQAVDFNQSKFLFALLLIFGFPIGANRYDLGNTLRKGKWWWKVDGQD